MGEVIRLVRGGRFLGWYIRYIDVDKRRKMRATHQPTKDLARRYLLEVEGRVARALVGIPEAAPPAPTLAALVERFLHEYERPRIKNLAAYRATARTALARLLRTFGEARVSDAITRRDVQGLHNALARSYRPATVATTLAIGSRVFSWAMGRGLVSQNPFAGHDLPSRQPLLEYLSRDEVTAVLTLAEQQAQAGDLVAKVRYIALVLALQLGLRKGELFGLRWRDIDFDAGQITVARSYATTPKGGKARHLRLPSLVAPILRTWAAQCPATVEGLILPLPGRSGPRMGTHQEMLGLPELLQRAGCRNVARAWHALRHTFASHYMMNGGNLLALQKLLGHASLAMTLVYSHLASDYLGDELEKLPFLKR